MIDCLQKAYALKLKQVLAYLSFDIKVTVIHYKYLDF